MEALDKLDTTCINTIRTLAMDAVQAANSGHPGTPMAMAPVAYYLWNRILRFDPDDPIWPNRDRFVLSMGHASMLLYSLLHLTGVKAVNAKYERLGEPTVKLDDIKRFRQLDSKCAGHPEYRWTSGVETTTGPLGQGVATSVGMAIGGKWQAAYFNRPGFELFNYDVYALAGDGCMMEGISGEAASRAGHLKLSNLCWVYDNNKITIEGHTDWAFSEDVATRFIAYGWNVTRVGDANDLEMLERAFNTFKNEKERPTLIIVDSHIAWGSPNKQDTHAAHGEPLGEEEIKLTKRNYGWPGDAKFLVPPEVPKHFSAGLGARGKELRSKWMTLYDQYRGKHGDLADQLIKMHRRELPQGWDKSLTPYPAHPQGAPGLITLRPGDANEVLEAWKLIMQLKHEPVALILSRQAMPTIDRTKFAPATGLTKGAYVVADAPGGKPDVILMATGSELGLVMAAWEQLAKDGVKARAVSMPSWELFDHQSQDYRDSVLPPSVTARVSVEQASTFGWHRFVGTTGEAIGMKTFGASAPLKELQKKFGFTVDAVVAAARKQLAGK